MTADDLFKALPGINKTWLDEFVSDVGNDYAALLYRELKFFEKNIDTITVPAVKKVLFLSSGSRFPLHYSFVQLANLHGRPIKQAALLTAEQAEQLNSALPKDFNFKPTKNKTVSTIPIKSNPSLTRENPTNAEKYKAPDKSTVAPQINAAPRPIAQTPAETSATLTAPTPKVAEQSKTKPLSNTFAKSTVVPNRVFVGNAGVKVQTNPLPNKPAATILEKNEKAAKPVVYSTKTTETILVKGKK